MKCKTHCKLVLAALAVPFAMAANSYGITIQSFSPPSPYDPTNPSDVAALDTLVGVTGFQIEDFEDVNLLTGLEVEFNGLPATSTPPVGGDGFNPVLADTVWDGNTSFSGNLTGGDLVFHFTDDAASVGIGVGDAFEGPVEFFVNGMSFGFVQDLPNFNQVADNFRDVYIRVDVGADPAINEIRFRNTVVADDVLRVDHLAFSPIAQGAVPEPITATLSLMSLGTVGLVTCRRRVA